MAKMYGGVRVYSYNYRVDWFNGIPSGTFNANIFNEKYQEVYGPMTARPIEMRAIPSSGTTFVWLYLAGGTHKNLFNYPTDNYTNQGQDWGFISSYHPVSGAFNAEYTAIPVSHSDVSKEITKLYGSAWIEEEKTELTYNSTESYNVLLTFDEPGFLSYIKGRTYSSGTYKDVDGLIVNYIAGTNTYTISLYDGSTLVSQETTNTQPTWITNIDDSSPSWQEHDDVAYSSVAEFQSKRIRKLYGSVNGVTKLVYEDTNA